VRRLTFALRQGKIDLISDQQVDMTLPAKPAPTPGADVPFWYELRDSTPGVLQRLPARDRIPLDSEVFSDDPKRSIARAEVVPPKVVFTVVIPDLEAVEEIRLMRAAPPSDPKAKDPRRPTRPHRVGAFQARDEGLRGPDMGANDGAIINATKILDNGADSARYNIVLVAEGYQAAQLGQFQTDAQNFVNVLRTTAPFDHLMAGINVHRLAVSSTDSGADDPAACGGSGAAPRTFFDATFCAGGGDCSSWTRHGSWKPSTYTCRLGT
jgi:hypothetical protein